jgi:hypothetical protein
MPTSFLFASSMRVNNVVGPQQACQNVVHAMPLYGSGDALSSRNKPVKPDR